MAALVRPAGRTCRPRRRSAYRFPQDRIGHGRRGRRRSPTGCCSTRAFSNHAEVFVRTSARDDVRHGADPRHRAVERPALSRPRPDQRRAAFRRPTMPHICNIVGVAVVRDRRARVQGRLRRHRRDASRPRARIQRLAPSATASTTACRTRSRSAPRRASRRRNLNAELGLYAQDKWTLKRLTLNGGLRFDYFSTRFPEQHLGPGAARAHPQPRRSRQLTGTTSRTSRRALGAAYDLFGNGQDGAQGELRPLRPGRQTRRSATRSSNLANQRHAVVDRRATGDYVPDCDLAEPAGQRRVRHHLGPARSAAPGPEHDLRPGGARRAGASAAVQLGVLDRRPARARAARRHRRRLLPPLLRQLHGDRQPRRRGDRLQPVQHHRARRPAAARRRRLHGQRPLRPEPEQGRPGRQLRHLRRATSASRSSTGTASTSP